MTADTSTSLCANIWCYFNFCSPTKFPENNPPKKCGQENNDKKISIILLFLFLIFCFSIFPEWQREGKRVT